LSKSVQNPAGGHLGWEERLRWRLAALLCLLTSSPLQAAEALEGRAFVIDGDTFTLRGERIRLHGVDAPEVEQSCRNQSGAAYRCGEWASNALSGHIGTGAVTCRGIERDTYGRLVAKCAHDGIDIGSWLVSNGVAVAFRDFGTDYEREEAAARAARRGLWSGNFDLPSAFRAAAQPGTGGGAQPTSPSCAIKGNRNANGACIYHLPGWRSYADTVITPSRGEKYYCSTAAAIAEGCRPAQ
jgi:endonuclease YncB( thermonuclease family)